MCGIVYVMRKDNKPAQKQVLKRYKAQKGRGDDGFGYVGIKQSGRATRVERFMFEHGVEAKLKDTKLTTILFHHRYPTSTPNLPESAHPITVSHPELQYDYHVVHNGVIQNDDTLKPEHEKLGYKYSTELIEQYKTAAGHVYYNGEVWNDSEAFAIELVRNIEGKTERAGATGSIAYVAMQIDKSTQQAVALYYGTNGGNPLTLQGHKDFVCIASEGGKAINDHMCYRMELPTGAISHYPQVQMPSAYQPKMGYGALGQARTHAPLHGSLSDGHDDDTIQSWPVGTSKHVGEHSELQDLEQQLADLDDEIIGLGGDITFAESEGDLEAEEQYRAELQSLLERREKIQTLYVKQANKAAVER